MTKVINEGDTFSYCWTNLIIGYNPFLFWLFFFFIWIIKFEVVFRLFCKIIHVFPSNVDSLGFLPLFHKFIVFRIEILAFCKLGIEKFVEFVKDFFSSLNVILLFQVPLVNLFMRLHYNFFISWSSA